VGVFALFRRWKSPKVVPDQGDAPKADKGGTPRGKGGDDYDARLDEELRELDG